MSDTVVGAVGNSIAKVASGDALLRPAASKLPAWLRFPLVVVLSCALSSLSYTVVATQWAVAPVELGSVSRHLEQWWEIGGVFAWRTVELAVGWFGNYDGYDIASLTVLSHGPPLYLLTTFYSISPTTAILSLAVDTITVYLPFRLLRPLSLAHSSLPPTSGDAGTVPNRDITSDLTIHVLTSFLAAAIYSVILYTAYASSFLPVALVTYFNSLPTIAPAHEASYVTLLPVALILGVAARTFIFTPITASASTNTKVAKKTAFNPATATLGETFRHNIDFLAGFGPRMRALVVRTATLCFLVGGNTVVQLAGTVEGVELPGAVEYAAVWVLGAAVVGGALGVVGAV